MGICTWSASGTAMRSVERSRTLLAYTGMVMGVLKLPTEK